MSSIMPPFTFNKNEYFDLLNSNFPRFKGTYCSSEEMLCFELEIKICPMCDTSKTPTNSLT